MIPQLYIQKFVENALLEDVGDGDHTSLSCIPSNEVGSAKLIIKQNGIVAGISVAVQIFKIIDPDFKIELFATDGKKVKPGDIMFVLSGRVHSILKAERLVLNVMQRMSGIATTTSKYVEKLKGLNTKVLDTRKTTPNFRYFEKEAVLIGGGANHRMGLFDMILIKDNHIDYAGGIENAIVRAQNYLKEKNKCLPIEVEVRSIDDINKIIPIGGFQRIMLDNFSVEQTRKAVEIINGKFETESSGGITLDTLRDYAECGVDFISVGALTHHVSSLDMSLKAM